MRIRFFKPIIVCVFTTPILLACAPPYKAQVEERKVLTVRQQSERIGGQLVRIVQSGDTMYSIAFASNLDVNRLAAWNNISDTSRLKVGQRIRLTEPIGFVAKRKPHAQVVTTNTKVKKPAAAGKRSKSSSSSRTVVDRATQNGRAKVNVQGKNVAKTKATNSKASPQSTSGLKLSWVWPVNGKLIRRFSPSSTQQGIDIASTAGQRVVATAAGEVVYVGNSLKGYGNLIIIKHNDNFLSAYAHNQAIFIKEGQKITDKQHIGSVGINNRRESALHFQIRRNGKPVDPLKYLPKARK